MAKISSSTTARLISDQLERVPEEALGSFPKLSSLARVTQRARNQSGIPPMHASHRADLSQLNGVFMLSSGEDFLKWDSGQSNDRILMFSTDANLDGLLRAEHWFADGT